LANSSHHAYNYFEKENLKSSQTKFQKETKFFDILLMSKSKIEKGIHLLKETQFPNTSANGKKTKLTMTN